MVMQMTPFRQALKAYSTLISLPAAISRYQSATNESLQRMHHAIAQLQPAPTPKHVIDIYERLGFRLMLDRSSIVDRYLIEQHAWEAEQVNYMEALTRRFQQWENPVFLDIGSYWGLYSLLAHRSKVFSEQIAFEADKYNHGQLEANLWLNNATNDIQVVSAAVSDVPGKLRFRDSRFHPDGNRGGSGVIGKEEALQGYDVDAITIDGTTSFSSRHLLMKIDVEGHEPAVLRGMKRTIAENKVVMQIEIFEQHHDQIFAEVERLGLRTIHQIYPDYYLTNLTPVELGI